MAKAKTTKKKAEAVAGALKAAAVATNMPVIVKPSVPMALDVKLVHSPEWPAIQAYVARASKIVISDKATCEGALREVEDGKRLKRASEAFFKAPKQAIDRVKKAVLDLEKEEAAALATVIGETGVLERRCIEWKRLDDERVEREARAIRERDEAIAREKRERELAEAEAAAQKLEDESPDLSPKELWFVTKMFEQEIDLDSRAQVDIAAMSLACKQAGYKDPRGQAEKLAKSPKIRAAIDAKKEIKAINEQAAAKREEPIITPAPIVESRVAKTSGTRFTSRYTLGGIDDLAKFIQAYRAGELPDEAMVPNEVHLRAMAKDLGEKFEQAYPGARVKKLEGVAG